MCQQKQLNAIHPYTCVSVHASAWLYIDKKGTIDYHLKVGQHPLEYTFPTLSGRNMHNDIVYVNIPIEASPAAEQFTGNIWYLSVFSFIFELGVQWLLFLYSGKLFTGMSIN